MCLLYSHCKNISRIAIPNYAPINQDILRVYRQSTGITSEELIMRDVTYRIYDCNGNYHNTWWHYVNADAVIFPVDISGYDLPYYHTHTVMDEALVLFDSLIDAHRFHKTPSWTLFFNRVDMLERKLATSPFDQYFVHFRGDPLCVEEVKAYIVKRFVSLNLNSDQNIAVCITDSVDMTSMGKLAFAALEKLEFRSGLSVSEEDRVFFC